MGFVTELYKTLERTKSQLRLEGERIVCVPKGAQRDFSVWLRAEIGQQEDLVRRLVRGETTWERELERDRTEQMFWFLHADVCALWREGHSAGYDAVPGAVIRRVAQEARAMGDVERVLRLSSRDGTGHDVKIATSLAILKVQMTDLEQEGHDTFGLRAALHLLEWTLTHEPNGMTERRYAV